MEGLIESILKQLECVMRGKKIDENILYHQSINLLEWSYSEYTSKGFKNFFTLLYFDNSLYILSF